MGLHNGELWSDLLLGNGLFSGIPIGLVLATTLILFSVRSLRGQRRKGPGQGNG